MGGAGPRATPSLSGDRVFTLGGTGILNALDANDGTAIWSRNAATDTETPLPTWAFSGSPLIVDDTVIVAMASTFAAYDIETGEPRWIGATGSEDYSSPHLMMIDGVAQVLLMRGGVLSSVDPADGKSLWEHALLRGGGILQPATTANGDILISNGDRTGMSLISVSKGEDGWATEGRWTSKRMKPYFSDYVVHQNHAYTFDGSMLACMDIEDGTRKWKGERYGSGQVLLLADQSLLLVLSERGQLILVEANPDQFEEIAQFPALDGKTWNHPVLVGDTLLVRNAEEMAAFRLALEKK